MNKKDAKKFEKLLVSELDLLTRYVRNIESNALEDSASVRETTGDLSSYAEMGTDNFERETALNIATNESERIRDITEALARIEQSNYGVCESCEEEIPRKRLEVFPSARYCVKCQSKFEKEGHF